MFDLTVGPAGATERVTAGCSRDWHIRPSPNPDRSSNLIEHWDGSRWSVVPRPDPGDYNFLADVAARSPTDAWAVGSTFDATGWHNLILHWDGASWTRIDAPSPGLEDNNLEAVVALG